jgi:competence protein ComEA
MTHPRGHTLWAIVVAAVTLLGSGAESQAWAAERAKERVPTLKTEARVNINVADEAELTKLKGVGRAMARRIIEYREANGEFKAPEEIQKVAGAGKQLWERNRDRIVVK